MPIDFIDVPQSTVIAGYRLQKRLPASSPQRAVYTALSLDTEEPAVIKMAPLEANTRRGSLADEFAILVQLEQASVITALGHGVWLPAQVQYLLLQLGGPSMADLLARQPGQRLQPGLALAAVHAAALALESLHDLGWVHGDVKPSNLLLNQDGSVTLTDLEFACRVGSEHDRTEKNAPFGGTPPFIAPELWREGRQASSPAADVWALGVVLYLAVAGEYPFGQDGLEEVRTRVLAGSPPHYSERIPDEIGKVCGLLLNHDRHIRPANGGLAARVLKEVLRKFNGEPQAALVAALRPLFSQTGDARMELADSELAPRDTDRLQVASTCLGPPTVTCLPAPVPPQATASEAVAGQEGVRRRTAARWFQRMIPHQSFALSVIFSGRPIQIVCQRGMSISIGDKEILLDAAEPVVEVEPCFPGCLVSPERIRADVTEQTALVRFWITPLTTGNLPGACVRIYYRNKPVQTIATPTKVSNRTLARAFAWFGFGWPLVSSILKAYDWTLVARMRQHFPLLHTLFEFLGAVPTTLLLMAILLGLAGLSYWLSRPIEGGDDLPVTVTPPPAGENLPVTIPPAPAGDNVPVTITLPSTREALPVPAASSS